VPDGTGWFFAANWANRFGFLSEGVKMDRVAGTTVLTGRVIDQAHLYGLIQRTRS
jgi:hypothetical protein